MVFAYTSSRSFASPRSLATWHRTMARALPKEPLVYLRSKGALLRRTPRVSTPMPPCADEAAEVEGEAAAPPRNLRTPCELKGTMTPLRDGCSALAPKAEGPSTWFGITHDGNRPRKATPAPATLTAASAPAALRLQPRSSAQVSVAQGPGTWFGITPAGNRPPRATPHSDCPGRRDAQLRHACRSAEPGEAPRSWPC